MEHWLQIFESNPEPSREDEYNDWADRVHVPDVMSCPGFVRGRRFRAREQRDGRGKYMTVYEIETDDLEKTFRLRAERKAEEDAQGRNRSGLVHPVWRNLAWKLIFERTAPQNSTSATGRWLNLVEQHCDPAREAEYHDWYDQMHIPDVLKTPSFVSARRYRAKERRDGRGTFLAVYEIETDDIEQTMKLRLAKREEEVKAGRASISRNHLARPVWRDVVWQQISDHRAKP